MFEVYNILSWKKEIYIFISSMLPVIELRGAIPLGVNLGFSLFKSTIISVLGNILIIPVLLIALGPIMEQFEKTKLFKGTVGRIKDRTMKKTKDKIKKYRTIGLFLLVAIPLPTTGVWTGSFAAHVLKLDIKKSFLSMALGVLVSGLIVSVLIGVII